jgi:5'-3' exonuclease
MGDLSHEEQKVGIIFGFMRQILTLSKVFDTNRFVFAWDSKRSFRRDIYNGYKSRSQRPQDEIVFEKFAFKQFIEIRTKTLQQFGFKNSFIQTGLEADDIIAAITQNYKREFVIISGDADLYQLLDTHVDMYSPKKRKLFTLKDFKEEYRITPDQWVMVKQVAGCRSDTVAGIDGIGEKRAIQYIHGALKHKTKGYKNIIAGKDIIAQNEVLVRLPFPGTKVPVLVDGEVFNLGNFIDLTDKYGFRSMQQITQLGEWERQFGMG